MKKLLLLSALFVALMCGIRVCAQNNDSFFDYGNALSKDATYSYDKNFQSDVNVSSNRAPLNGGLLLLGVFAMAYALKK